MDEKKGFQSTIPSVLDLVIKALPIGKAAPLTHEERALVKMQDDLARAISRKDRKARGRIFNGLPEIEAKQFLVLMRLIDRRVISEGGILVANLVNSFVDHKKAKRLFELLFSAVFFDAYNQQEGDRFLITTLFLLGAHINFSSSLVKAAINDVELANNVQFMAFYCLKNGLGFKAVPQGNYYFPWIGQPGSSEKCFAWPLQPSHLEWTSALLAPVQAKWQAEDDFLKMISEKPADWSIIDRLWERLKAEAIYGLHLDGDHIRFNLPEMAIYRLTGLTLQRGANLFPDTDVQLHTETFGIKQDIRGRLVNGRLDFAEEYWCEYAQWYITLAVVIGYFQVVTGQDPDKDPWYAQCHSGKRCETIERRPAKPHFYTLRPGHKASEEAKTNCLYYFGRELAPGKTFRVGKKMVIVTKPKISTVVTPEGMKRHAG